MLACDYGLIGPILPHQSIPCLTNPMSRRANVERCAEPGYVGLSMERTPLGGVPQFVVSWRRERENAKVAGAGEHG